ncbi:unnamed protein product, partial [Didymodactylos carnosus]
DIIVRPQWIRKIAQQENGKFQFAAFIHESNESSYTPLLIFINKRSGGQTGANIYEKLLNLLNPRQIFLLDNSQTILQALEIYRGVANLHICVFGGDGSVGWVLAKLAEVYDGPTNPPVAICPLGTGNDLSRVLNWGREYESKRLLTTLLQIPAAEKAPLDRWHVELESIAERQTPDVLNGPSFLRETNRLLYENFQMLPNSYFINYMSFGLDAAIALDFHDHRARKPSKFSSPWKNKVMYINESLKYVGDFAKASRWDLRGYMKVICDGVNLTYSLRNCHTLVILNIPGYASGTNPWGKSSTTFPNKEFSENEDAFELETLHDGKRDESSTPTTMDRQDFGDKKLEIVGLSATHMGLIHVGFHGQRIAQCSHLTIELQTPMLAQLDGEPFYIPASVVVKVTHSGQVMVLRYNSV